LQAGKTSTQSPTDSPRPVSTRFIAWCAIIGALFFISFGATFGVVASESLGTCVFGDGPCSAAAATWSLVLITLFAFLAAYQAALSASESLAISTKTYALETEPVLSQTVCENKQHELPRLTLFIEDQQITLMHPTSRPIEAFGQVDFDFQNLGRSALLDVVVELILTFDTVEKPFPVTIGSIAALGDAHVRVCILWDADTLPSIEWNPTASTRHGDVEFSAWPCMKVEVAVDKGGHRSWRLSFPEKTPESVDVSKRTKDG
jgi:hypothetical protein